MSDFVGNDILAIAIEVLLAGLGSRCPAHRVDPDLSTVENRAGKTRIPAVIVHDRLRRRQNDDKPRFLSLFCLAELIPARSPAVRVIQILLDFFGKPLAVIDNSISNFNVLDNLVHCVWKTKMDLPKRHKAPCRNSVASSRASSGRCAIPAVSTASPTLYTQNVSESRNRAPARARAP